MPARTARYFALACIAVTAVAVTVALWPGEVSGDEPWSVTSFVGRYQIGRDGSITATEDITADFDGINRHGIFRDIPIAYPYDAEHDRVIDLSVQKVEANARPVPFETSESDGNLQIKIGDPDRLVSGSQHYRLVYLVKGALTSFADHDELYWNVTGHHWPVRIEKASAVVDLPGSGVQKIDCFQGEFLPTTRCAADSTESSATFSSAATLAAGSDFTIVVALDPGAVDVPAPILRNLDSAGLVEFFGVSDPIVVAGSVLVGLVALCILARQWWITGRDRWFGDRYYLADSGEERIKPPFSHETIVVEYQPPEIPAKGRRLRPAEVGLLLDERADTLDVSATVIDLAVRGFLRVEELPKEGFMQMRDYELSILRPRRTSGLLRYERLILLALFRRRTTIRISELGYRASLDLRRAKEELYREALASRFFPRDPESVQSFYQLVGIGVLAGAGLAMGLLGLLFGAALLPLPIAVAGVALFFLAHAMPCRTAIGRQMYRRCLGFRRYLVTAEQARQRFAERANIFDEYLPYAMVFHCVRRWARAFESLGAVKETSWYTGHGAFGPGGFVLSLQAFSGTFGHATSALGSAGGGGGGAGFSGGGFGGGGFAGGGAGGGGGGSW